MTRPSWRGVAEWEVAALGRGVLRERIARVASRLHALHDLLRDVGHLPISDEVASVRPTCLTQTMCVNVTL